MTPPRQVSGPIAVARALLRAMYLGGLHVRLPRWVGLTLSCALWLGALTGCPEDAPVVAVGLAGSEGRARYVVTMDTPVADLSEYRALQKDQPDAVAALVDRQRASTAAAQASLDVVVRGVGGRVVSRWWMSGQATIEIAPAALATVRAAPGVKNIAPDTALQ